MIVVLEIQLGGFEDLEDEDLIPGKEEQIVITLNMVTALNGLLRYLHIVLKSSNGWSLVFKVRIPLEEDFVHSQLVTFKLHT